MTPTPFNPAVQLLPLTPTPTSPHAFPCRSPSFLIQNDIMAVDIKGLYSNPPVYFVCCDWGHKDAKEGLPTFPLGFHYIQGAYLRHISFILDDMRLCGDLPTATNATMTTSASVTRWVGICESGEAAKPRLPGVGETSVVSAP